jgi:tryptophan halogenase
MTPSDMTGPDSPTGQRQAVVIVGNGLAAWLTAVTLARAVSTDDFSMTVVGDENAMDPLEPFIYADTTLPSANGLLQATGLNEEQVIARTGGSISHGIAFSGWANPTTSYIQPFGSIGAALGPVSFHQLALRLRQEGIPLRLANFSLAALAAQAGRCVPGGSDPQSVLATCQRGLHLDCNKLADILRNEAAEAGVLVVSGAFDHTEQDAQGDLGAIITADGKRVEGDLFIDCSGVGGVVANAVAKADWQDWSSWLPCNSIVSGIVSTPSAPPPYSHAEAINAGWIRHVPLQGRTLLNGLYDAERLTEEQMLNTLLQSSASNELHHIQSGALRFGRRKNPWQRNCIGLGSAAAVVDPVALSNLQLLISGVSRLSGLMPAAGELEGVRNEYNRQTALFLDHARDFAIMHYKLNGRRDEPFWDACRAMQVPQEPAYKLQLFESRGRVPMYDEEPLEETAWLSLFDEHGVVPGGYSRIVDGFKLQDLHKHLERVRSVMLDSLQKIPLHADYLADINRKRQ